MATTHTDVRVKPTGKPAPERRTRRNEIIAIVLFAVSALLALCLVSYNPNDPSWNASGQAATRNWIGQVGANLAATLFQIFGLAALLWPILLTMVAWRRFRERHFHAPLSRIIGLVTLLLTVSSLCALFITTPLMDKSFRAGGLLGAFISEGLVSVLNTVGAGVLLLALTAVGLLLATNFSFALAYERVAGAVLNPSGFFRTTLERYRAWRAQRHAQAQARAEARRTARAERERQLLEARESSLELTDEEASVAEEALPVDGRKGAHTKTSTGLGAIKRAANASVIDEETSREEEIRARLARAEAELAAIAAEPGVASQTPRKGASEANSNAEAVSASPEPFVDASSSAAPTGVSPNTRRIADAQVSGKANAGGAARAKTASGSRESATDADAVEEMLREAAVVRTEVDDDGIGSGAEDEAFAASPSVGKNESGTRRATQQNRLTGTLTDFKFPDIEFLNAPPPRHEQADEELLQIATRVAEKCREFNVTGQIKHICPGPVVTTYEFKPDPGVKYSRVTGLVDDLCIALEAESVRIDRLPGKPHVGIEVPNPQRETIFLREVIESRAFRDSPSKLTLALGKTIDGMNYAADLTRMPHLLIAGATGTGKSVCLNSLVVSILYKARPDEVKFIMIDPKRLELGLYADIPHLATPIITEPKKAANALKWAVAQMEQRYKDLARWGVRNIDGFNSEVERRNNVLDFDEEGQPHKPLPYIVIIIDELADLMMTCGHDVEESITRLAQMARAVGIHLVLATQRPSVDVITGLIKANFPSRIAFRVSSKVDSRTIIDANGAEQLLGRGDMLFLPPGTSRLVRVHGAYLDETEVSKVVAHVKAQGDPVYDETITQSEEEAQGGDGMGGERDELFEQALRICVEMKRASTSVLQRRLRIGYGRAAAILDMMEREGFIGPADGARPRPILGRAYETVSHWDDLQEGGGEEG